MSSKSPKPKRGHAFGEIKKGYKAMRSKIRTPRDGGGEGVRSSDSGTPPPAPTLSASSLPRPSHNDSTMTTPSPRHVRQESLDRQIRGVDSGDDEADLDARMRKLLDERDRYQLKLEDVEDKSENLESLKQEVLDSNGSWTQSHERKYLEKSQKYAKKVERYRKTIEDIDEQIGAYDSAARRKNRFSVGGGSMKQFAYGISGGIAATGAGLRRMFNNDGSKPEGSPELDGRDSSATDNGHAAVQTELDSEHSSQRDRSANRATGDRYNRPTPLGGGVGPPRTRTPRTAPVAHSASDTLALTPDEPDMQGAMRPRGTWPADKPTGSHLQASRGQSDTDSIGGESVSSRTSNALSMGGGKKSRFTFWTGKDKTSHGSLVASGAQVTEHDAVNDLLIAISDLRTKTLETHEMSERSTVLRDSQGTQLRDLEARLAERDKEVAELRSTLQAYDKRIETMVTKYEEQLQADVRFVAQQVADERKKVLKLEGELRKQQAELKTAEDEIKQQVSEQKRRLNMLSSNQNIVEQWMEKVFGTSKNTELVYVVGILVLTILFLSRLS